MTPREAADRLLRAEAEYRAAQFEHDGTMKATVRSQSGLERVGHGEALRGLCSVIPWTIRQTRVKLFRQRGPYVSTESQ